MHQKERFTRKQDRLLQTFSKVNLVVNLHGKLTIIFKNEIFSCTRSIN